MIIVLSFTFIFAIIAKDFNITNTVEKQATPSIFVLSSLSGLHSEKRGDSDRRLVSKMLSRDSMFLTIEYGNPATELEQAIPAFGNAVYRKPKLSRLHDADVRHTLVVPKESNRNHERGPIL
ncbi:hypothetical protein F5884DRAFT_530769 [Xylogone sp. PMI_703]|nr:hypothetical protein F5884DRAFT_530769 [Xylogone sp. PMI_703]